MSHPKSEKWKKTNNGRNRTIKSRNNQNDLRKGKLQIIGKTEKTIQSNKRRQKKIAKRVPKMNEKTSWTQTQQQKFHQRGQHLRCHPC